MIKLKTINIQGSHPSGNHGNHGKSGKLIYGHGIMEKVMELPTISGNSVQVVVKN